METGTWFEYEVEIERSDMGVVRQFNERYELLSKEGDILHFSMRENFDDKGMVDGSSDYASGIFDHKGLIMDHTEQYSLVGETIPVDVYVSDRCGGGETMWVGKDDVVYKDIRTQMWSMGVMYKETRTLFAFSLR